MKRFKRALAVTMLAAGVVLAAPSIADHGKHYGPYDDHGVRVFPSNRGWRHGYSDHRWAPRPFDRRHWRHGHRRFNGHYRYYPGYYSGPVYVRPRHVYPGHGGYVDHFHRNRPLLSVRVDIDRYSHCPDHGGYFLRNDQLGNVPFFFCERCHNPAALAGRGERSGE